MRFVSQTQVESLKLIGIKWLTLPKKEDIKTIHQLMIEDLKQREMDGPFEKDSLYIINDFKTFIDCTYIPEDDVKNLLQKDQNLA